MDIKIGHYLIVVMNKTSGGLSVKISVAPGDKLIAKDKINCDPVRVGLHINVRYNNRNLTVEDEDSQDAGFTTGSVVPLMVEIRHF